MKKYTKGLIVLSALFILPTFASAADLVDMENLDVTMTVVESPNDSPMGITNRIDVPSEEYMQARERNQRQERFRQMDGDRDHESMEGSQEMMQAQMQNQQQEMMQNQQEMMQDQQAVMQDQQQDMQAEGTGSMGGGGRMGM